MKQSLTLFQNLKTIFRLGRWPKIESLDYISWIMEYDDGSLVVTSPSSEKARLRKKRQPKYFTLLYMNEILINKMEIPENHIIIYRLQRTINAGTGKQTAFVKIALWDKTRDKFLIHFWFTDGTHEIMKHWGNKPFDMPVLRQVELLQ